MVASQAQSVPTPGQPISRSKSISELSRAGEEVVFGKTWRVLQELYAFESTTPLTHAYKPEKKKHKPLKIKDHDKSPIISPPLSKKKTVRY